MTFKSFVKQMDGIAGPLLPLRASHLKRLTTWAALHGWDVSSAECQRLLVRQAILNAILQQTVPTLKARAFVTPLDILEVKLPSSLLFAIEAAMQEATAHNFWGEFYNALIPQSQRRQIGQFWTNERIAKWMVVWLLRSTPGHLMDLGCGTGNFLRAAAQINPLTRLSGFDISPLLLNVALATFLAQPMVELSVLPDLSVQNYLETVLPPETDAVICNPPYTRHHHIAPTLKDSLQAFFEAHLHLDVSRQGTLAFYFLLKLIADLPDGARAAVIVPMEVLDARYGRAAKWALCQHTTLTAMIHFAPEMNAFHKVDVGASILFFRKGRETLHRVRHVTLTAMPSAENLLECLESEPPVNRDLSFGSLVVQPQDELLEIPKWFSIAAPKPVNADWQSRGLVVPLKALVKVVRGIATGANEFFALPTHQVEQRALTSYVVRTLQRNREIQNIILDEERWQALSGEGKRVWLLYLNGEDVDIQPALQAYLAEGEARGYHRGSLVQTRKHWYAMEQREVPPIFFTILTRGNPRFILNQAGVRPLNMFSLIYPNRWVVEAGATALLWAFLNSHFSLSRLHSVSRTYGGKTLKVEPRELDNLPVINPLALPASARQKLTEYIEDFYRHRQTTVFLRQVDEVVEAVLAGDGSGQMESMLPLQLQLLEAEANYK